MREIILECARRIKKDTQMKQAFLRAIGIPIPKRDYFTIYIDESKDIEECFKNKQRVRL